MEGTFQVKTQLAQYHYVELYRLPDGFKCCKLNIEEIEALTRTFKTYNNPLGERIFEADVVDGLNFLATLGYHVRCSVGSEPSRAMYLLEKPIEDSTN